MPNQYPQPFDFLVDFDLKVEKLRIVIWHIFLKFGTKIEIHSEIKPP